MSPPHSSETIGVRMISQSSIQVHYQITTPEYTVGGDSSPIRRLNVDAEARLVAQALRTSQISNKMLESELLSLKP